MGVVAAAVNVDQAAIEWIRDGAPDEVEDAVSVLHESLSELASQINVMRPEAPLPAVKKPKPRKRK